MGRVTTKYRFPYPVTGDPADGPAAFQQLAQAVETSLSSEISHLNSDLRGVIGSTGGKVSMRSYVDTRDQALITDYKTRIKNGDDDVIAAYKKADAALEKRIETEYDDAFNKVGQLYNGNIVASIPAIGVNETRNISNEFTIPSSSRRRMLVVHAAALWTSGYGDVAILLNGTARRSARTHIANQSGVVSVAFELSTSTSYALQLRITGLGPNDDGNKDNVVTPNEQYTYIQAHTIPGGG